MILCLYKMCVCVVTDAVRLCTLQSIVFPKLIILFTITKLLLPLDANTLPTDWDVWLILLVVSQHATGISFAVFVNLLSSKKVLVNDSTIRSKSLRYAKIEQNHGIKTTILSKEESNAWICEWHTNMLVESQRALYDARNVHTRY